jgi:hypothetical protein
MRTSSRLDTLLFPLTHWHWKAALVTAVFRAGACMAALWHAPLNAREHFGVVEAAYVLLTAGVFSAWQQQAMGIRSKKIAWVITVLAIPLGSLAADSALHLWLDRGNMRALGVGALIATLISAMFHWHVMQNGAMIIGTEARPFWDDMKQMPRLAATFVWDPLQRIIGRPAAMPAIATEEEEYEVAA